MLPVDYTSLVHFVGQSQAAVEQWGGLRLLTRFAEVRLSHFGAAEQGQPACWVWQSGARLCWSARVGRVCMPHLAVEGKAW